MGSRSSHGYPHYPALLLALAAALGPCVYFVSAGIAAPDPAAHAGTKAMFSAKAKAEAAAKQLY